VVGPCPCFKEKNTFSVVFIFCFYEDPYPRWCPRVLLSLERFPFFAGDIPIEVRTRVIQGTMGDAPNEAPMSRECRGCIPVEH
jgi:hypothetical protein